MGRTKNQRIDAKRRKQTLGLKRNHMELKDDKYSENYKKEAYVRAQKRLKEIKGFYWHAFWYAVVNIFFGSF